MRYFILSSVYCLLFLILTTIPISAQTVPIKSIPLPTGSGARALGQGGAFIAVADDATAASWNPAGLIQLEKPELSMVGSYLITNQNFSVRDDSRERGFNDTLDNEDVGRWDLNYMSIAYPFRIIQKNFVAAFNYHQILDFHTDINFNTMPRRRNNFGLESNQIDFKSSGGVGSLSPSIAMLLFPKLSIGLTVNIFDDEFFNSHGWTETLTGSTLSSNSGVFERSSIKQKVSSRDYHGANVSLGLLWDVWEKEDRQITFGAVYHSAYTARFDQERKLYTKSSAPLVRLGSTLNDLLPPTLKRSKSRVKMDWPMSIGLGVGFRWSDALSFSFDITWEDWSEWVQKSKEEGVSVPDSRPIGNGSKHDEIDDTFSARFGTEYLMFFDDKTVAFRGGMFYEQRPSLGASDFDVNGNPEDADGDPMDVLGFSLGAGLSTKRFSIDAAYQFRYIRDMEGGNIGLPGTEIDTTENLFLTSFIIYM